MDIFLMLGSRAQTEGLQDLTQMLRLATEEEKRRGNLE